MLSAERQILNLLHGYAERLDAGDIEGVADLFEHAAILTDDAREIRGREGVLHMLRPDRPSNLRLPPTGERRRTKHVTTNVIIELDELEMRGRARSVYVVIAETDQGDIRILTAGRYDDEFESVDGKWRFATRRYHQDLAPVGS